MEIILTNNLKSKLEIYLLDNKIRPLILIAAGGGYKYTSERESMPIVKKFHEMGYHAALIKYREEIYYHPQPIFDMALAVKYINNNKNELCVNKLGLCGFSAGGHLVASFLVHRYEEYIINHIKGSKDDLNVDFDILCYPVITSIKGIRHDGSFENLIGNINDSKLMDYMSIEKWVDNTFPKTFIFTTLTDNSVPMESTLLMIEAFRRNNVNFESHIFPCGSHGLSLANKETARNDNEINPHVSRWINMVEDWLEYILNE